LPVKFEECSVVLQTLTLQQIINVLISSKLPKLLRWQPNKNVT